MLGAHTTSCRLLRDNMSGKMEGEDDDNFLDRYRVGINGVLSESSLAFSQKCTSCAMCVL